jgi:hypothetical protein
VQIRASRLFRINTCISVSKQTTLSLFKMNTYEKRGRGDPGHITYIASKLEVVGAARPYNRAPP